MEGILLWPQYVNIEWLSEDEADLRRWIFDAHQTVDYKQI